MGRGTSRTRIRRGARTFGAFALSLALAAVSGAPLATRAQTPPTPAPAPFPSVTPVPGPAAPPPPSPDAGAPATPSPEPSPTPTPTPGAVPSAAPEATQPPIIVDPPGSGVTPGGFQTLHLQQVAGTVTATVADPAIAAATIDQNARTLTIAGLAVGTTVVTVRDSRGLARDVPVRVAYPAGTIATSVSLRVTGRPASPYFLREQAVDAAIRGVRSRPGASVVAPQDAVDVPAPLRVDDVTTVDVPVIVQGDGYITAQGTTRVRIENFAQPSVRPEYLLVSDYPETLTENGTLFGAELTAKAAARFLYFHYNPGGQPDRSIVLRVQNPSSQPALVQFIAGQAGPDLNEMQVGHLATQRFLVRLAQNEGTVVTVPGNTTATLMTQALPAQSVASGLLQLHEISGVPLHMSLVAQDASAPDGGGPETALLSGGRPHARGVYPIPEFYFDYNYDAQGPNLEVPIGQIPLPNLVQGQTLAGDYGVLQSVTIRMVNTDRRNARQIALYANPRGGRATGTFVIDRVLVQAHAMPAFGHFKLRQYTIAPGSFVRTEIVTMPEGGSSYPLRLVVAPDDGSPAPGTADSVVY